MRALRGPQVWILLFVLCLGLFAASMGFVANAKRTKAHQIQPVDNDVCHYPGSPAYRYALLGALALVVAQITINTAGGCICCAYGPDGHFYPASSNRTLSILCLVSNWVTFIIGLMLFLAGAGLNQQRDASWYGNTCPVAGPMVFPGAALLALATVLFAGIYYVAAISVRNAAWSAPQLPQYNQQGIAMGQPAYGVPTGFPYGSQPGPSQTYPVPAHPAYGQDHQMKG